MADKQNIITFDGKETPAPMNEHRLEMMLANSGARARSKERTKRVGTISSNPLWDAFAASSRDRAEMKKIIKKTGSPFKQ